MKRLCIYLTYDRQNIIDDYIGHMLKELKSCVGYLAVVCNMPEVVRGREILETHADRIFYRENVGFDAGGFKEALCRFIGWDKVLEYDELVLVNDSMFGPFRPMAGIFAEMEEKSVDFWGLAKHGERRGGNRPEFCEHIQSYFLVICRHMLHDIRFREYWETMPFYAAFEDVICQHEVRFTRHFFDMGYSYGTLADTEANDSKTNLGNNYSQYSLLAFEMIRRRNFPFLKKRPLTYDTLGMQTQENLRLAVNYIDRETGYDVNLIWDHIIRILNMADMQRNLCLQYVIVPVHEKGGCGKKVSVAVFVKHEEAVEAVLEYLCKLDANCFVKIISEDPGLLAEYRVYGWTCIKGAWGEWRLFRELCGYDFVCILHDADMTSDIRPSHVEKSYFYNIWENLLKDSGHVAGIVKTFECEPRLGFLASPQPNFASYFGECGKGWDGSFEGSARAVENLQLNCQISQWKAPFRVTNDFWIRGRILKRLADLREGDIAYLPCLWSYLAQDAGYYSGIVESAEYVAMNEVNLQHHLASMAAYVRKTCGGFETFAGWKERITIAAMREFCVRHSRIFLYGTGFFAEKYKDRLINVVGCVVSDGQNKTADFHGLPVAYLSEVSVSDDCGIILCMDEQNQAQVIPLLERLGICHYFCI